MSNFLPQFIKRSADGGRKLKKRGVSSKVQSNRASIFKKLRPARRQRQYR